MASNSPRHDVEPVAISSELNDGASTLTSSAAPSPSPPVDSDDGGGETGSNVDGDPLPTNSFVDDNTGSLRGSIMVSQGRMVSCNFRLLLETRDVEEEERGMVAWLFAVD